MPWPVCPPTSSLIFFIFLTGPGPCWSTRGPNTYTYTHWTHTKYEAHSRRSSSIMIRGKQLTDLRWETTTARFPPPHPHYLKDAVSTDLGQSGASLPPKYPEWRPRNPASGVVPHCELDWEPKPCLWSLECWTTQSEYTTQAQAPSGKVRCSPEVQGVPRRPGSCPASCTTIAASHPVGSFNCSKHVLASNALQKPPFRPASACSFLLHQACSVRAQKD